MRFISSTDLNECEKKVYECHKSATCTNGRGSYSCKCNHGFIGHGLQECYYATSCSMIRVNGSTVSGKYVIDPDGKGGLAPFTVPVT